MRLPRRLRRTREAASPTEDRTVQQLTTLNEPGFALSRRCRMLICAGLVACLLVLGGGDSIARAAFPGTNGKIAFSTLSDSGDFVSDFGDFDIFVMNADGSGLVALTGYGADDSQPAFSPDGSRIAFTSSRTGNAEIFVMSADGTNVTQVTHNSAEEFDPAFSADGARIAFASDR